MENWKDIKNYEGYYKVSDLGRIKSVARVIVYKNNDIHYYKEKIISQTKNNKTGYMIVKLSKNNKQFTITTHRLVAKSFITNYDNKPLVNHKNGVKIDNRVSNLEWCTQKENMEHAVKCLRFDNKNKITNKKTKCSNGMFFNSTYDAAIWINNTIFHNTKKIHTIANDIRCVCNKKKKKRKCNGKIREYIRTKAYGFFWEYIN